MGKVKSAVMCVYDPAARVWVVPPRYRMVAIKQLYKVCVAGGITTEGRPVREDPLSEIAMLQYLSDPGHPNVMSLLDFMHDDRCYYAVYEMLAGGELFDQVQAHGKVPEATVRHYIWECLQGMRYIHARGVTHRDLSLENAMRATADAAARVKLIDFGLGVFMPPDPDLLANDGRVGKEKYMAPETYAGRPYSGRAIDVWCLGMMTFILLFGIYPYTVPSVAACPYFAAIAEGKLVKLLHDWKMAATVSVEVLDLLPRMLQVEAAARIHEDDVEAHPWFDPVRPAAGGGMGAGTGAGVGFGGGAAPTVAAAPAISAAAAAGFGGAAGVAAGDAAAAGFGAAAAAAASAAAAGDAGGAAEGDPGDDDGDVAMAGTGGSKGAAAALAPGAAGFGGDPSASQAAMVGSAFVTDGRRGGPGARGR